MTVARKKPNTSTFVSVIRDTLKACPDRSLLFQVDSLQDCWATDSLDSEFKWWFAEKFVTNREEYLRMHRVSREMERFFRDLSRLTGDPYSIKLVKKLQERLLCAFFPTARAVTQQATRGGAEKAKRILNWFLLRCCPAKTLGTYS